MKGGKVGEKKESKEQRKRGGGLGAMLQKW